MSDDGEPARPLTAGEIEAIRARGVWDAGLGYWQTVDRLLATLDAWRPVLEHVAVAPTIAPVVVRSTDTWRCVFGCDLQPNGIGGVEHSPDCLTVQARRLLGQEA